MQCREILKTFYKSYIEDPFSASKFHEILLGSLKHLRAGAGRFGEQSFRITRVSVLIKP